MFMQRACFISMCFLGLPILFQCLLQDSYLLSGVLYGFLYCACIMILVGNPIIMLKVVFRQSYPFGQCPYPFFEAPCRFCLNDVSWGFLSPLS